MLARQPQQQLAAVFAEVAPDHAGPKHPGALHRMPTGRARAGRAAGFDVARADQELAGLAMANDGDVIPSSIGALEQPPLGLGTFAHLIAAVDLEPSRRHGLLGA